jgi:enterochelin esterase-like enzyme
MPVIEPSFADLKSVWMCAVEVTNIAPGQTIEVDPDTLAFPKRFSEAPTGSYQFMALLDLNHSYAYSGMGAGDLYSPVVRLVGLHPDQPKAVSFILSHRSPEMRLRETASRKKVNFKSELLTAFAGHPIEMRAGVILPPSYGKSTSRRYPTVYQIHGYSSSYADAWSNGEDCCGPSPSELIRGMADGTWPEMIYVFLDATCPLGHHVFADSANNGPWGRALVEEFIPYLEKAFRMEATPSSRFLNGHSSGGWATLWVQVSHPDFFGGTWSTSPDPVDFRNWTGPNLTKLPPDNFYHKSDGSPRWLIRMDGVDVITVEEFARWEAVAGDYGGQFGSFDAVFSPRGADGRPMRLFNRATGEIDPVVQKAWEKYDISRLLKKDWANLGPKLKGKIHVAVGTKDTVHLEESVYLLRDTLMELGSDASFTFLEGRDHFNVYEGGLARKMAWEMYGIVHPGESKSTSP